MNHRAKVPENSGIIPTPLKFSWLRVLTPVTITLVTFVVIDREFYQVTTPAFQPTPQESPHTSEIYTPHAPTKYSKSDAPPFTKLPHIWVEECVAQEVRAARILNQGSFDKLHPLPNDAVDWRKLPLSVCERNQANVHFLKATTPQRPETYHVRISTKLIVITAPDEQGWVWGAKAVIERMEEEPEGSFYKIQCGELEG
jgi:hypothetical protein